MIVAVILALIAAPMPDGPDVSVLSRPIGGSYQNLLTELDLPHDFDLLHYNVAVQVFVDQQMV